MSWPGFPLESVPTGRGPPPCSPARRIRRVVLPQGVSCLPAGSSPPASAVLGLTCSLFPRASSLLAAAQVLRLPLQQNGSQTRLPAGSGAWLPRLRELPPFEPLAPPLPRAAPVRPRAQASLHCRQECGTRALLPVLTSSLPWRPGFPTGPAFLLPRSSASSVPLADSSSPAWKGCSHPSLSSLLTLL